MEPKKEKIFADGIMFKRPRDGAPSFVKGNISIKVSEFGVFLSKHEKNGWVNLDLKESAGGKLYLELNTWEKKVDAPKPAEQLPKENIDPNDIPFNQNQVSSKTA